MKLRTEINWWIPGGSIVYIGTPKTRAAWVQLTWRGYVAWWHLIFLALWKTIKR
jgi:hypothetical protein